MLESHHSALLAGYATAIAGWHVFARTPWFPDRRDLQPPPRRTWKELGMFIAAVVAILLIGRAWSKDWLLPHAPVDARGIEILHGIVNQVLIFSPALSYLATRAGSYRDRCWLPRTHLPLRLGLGFVLAVLAAFLFSLVRFQDLAPGLRLLRSAVDPGHLHLLVQVFLEDLVIALAAIHVAGVSRRAWVPPFLVGVAFAAGHVPALTSAGATASELASLFLDAGLGVFVLFTLQRSRDLLWFFPVHYVLDLSQFLKT